MERTRGITHCINLNHTLIEYWGTVMQLWQQKSSDSSTHFVRCSPLSLNGNPLAAPACSMQLNPVPSLIFAAIIITTTIAVSLTHSSCSCKGTMSKKGLSSFFFYTRVVVYIIIWNKTTSTVSKGNNGCHGNGGGE